MGRMKNFRPPPTNTATAGTAVRSSDSARQSRDKALNYGVLQRLTTKPPYPAPIREIFFPSNTKFLYPFYMLLLFLVDSGVI